MATYSFKSAGKTRAQRNDEATAIAVEPPPIGFVTPLRPGEGKDGLFAMHRSLEAQLSDNLRNLLLTNWGERVGLHNFGANLRPLVLEYTGLDAFDGEAIERIRSTVSKWMPYVELTSFTSDVRRDRGSSKLTAVDVTVNYRIPSLSKLDMSVTVTLYVSLPMTREDAKPVRPRRYLARDFGSLRESMVDYARRYYPDKVQDMSEAGTGGLLVDLAAIVGDNLSFYLDHQYTELDPDRAVENVNIERALKVAGVPITGAAAANVNETVTVEIPADGTRPQTSALPVVLAGSIFSSDSDVRFALARDIDFSETDASGTLLASVTTGKSNPDGTPKTFLVSRTGPAVSGFVTTDVIPLGSGFVPFKRVTLAQRDVSEIVSVRDDLGNVYYEVTDLSQDTVYGPVTNLRDDADEVRDNLRVIPAPYRYTREVELGSRSTVLTLGGGSAETFDDDIIPDPSDFAFPYAYRSSFPVQPLDPGALLTSKTLGVYAPNTNLNVTYRYGGGLAHNVPAGSIQNVQALRMSFPGNPSVAVSRGVRASVTCNNASRATDGDDPPTVDELRSLIGSYRNSQSRIVTRDDLLARVYTLPSNYGRVFRAGIGSNPTSPLATQLHIVSRDADGRLTTSSDTLKKNIRTYLNPYRLISDAIDILDVAITNVGIEFDVSLDTDAAAALVLQQIIAKLKRYFDVRRFNVDQPIVVSDAVNLAFTVPGVVAVNSVIVSNITGVKNNREYPGVYHDIPSHTRKSLVYPPKGGMFEVRFPDSDIVGHATLPC